MLYDKTVSESYLDRNLLYAIQASVGELGKAVERVSVEDLEPV